MLQAEKGSGGNGGQDQRLGVFHNKFIKLKKKKILVLLRDLRKILSVNGRVIYGENRTKDQTMGR